MSTGSPDFDKAQKDALAEWQATLDAEAAAARPATPEPVAPAPAVAAVETPASVEPAVEPVPEVIPASPETPAVAATTPEEAARVNAETALNERLTEARKQYLTKKLEWERSKGLLQSTFVQNTESRAQLQQSLDTVEAEYNAAFAELRAVNAEKAMDEGLHIAEQKACIISGEAGPKRLTAWYKKLGETSILGTENYQGPFKRTVKFATSNRTLLNAGLIGGAILVGPGGWVAGGAFVGRRILSGFGAGVGTMDMVKSARMKYLQKELNAESSLSDIDNQLESLLARAALDGTVDQLESTEHYRELTASRQEVSRRVFAESTPEEKHAHIALLMIAKDSYINERIDKEKNWNRGALAAGLAAGAFVGSGKMMELLKSTGGKIGLGISDWFSKEGTTASPAPAEVSAPQAPNPSASAGLTVENDMRGMVPAAASVETALQVGNRGIEGALLDHLKTDKGAKMMEWLQAQDYNKGVTDKGALVHRFASHYAEEKGFNIDQGGGNDLSKIFGAEVKVDGSGAIHIGEEKFMPAASVVEHADVGPQLPEEVNTDIQSNDINSPETVNAEVDPTSITEEVEKAKQATAEAIELRRGISNHNPLFTPEGETGADVADAATAAETAGDNGVDTNVAQPAAAGSTEISGRFEAALSQEKASYAMQLLLDKKYPGFLKDMHVSEGALNKISKMSHSEFLEKCANSESFRDTYREIAATVKRSFDPTMEKLNMKNIIVTIYKVRQEKGLI